MLLTRMVIPRAEKRINYSQHEITDDDKKAVTKALDSGWIAGNGPISRQYTEALCNYTGYKYALPVCNGTVALYLAYMALDNVVWRYQYKTKINIPDLTFVATANAALMARIEEIRFIDVDNVTLTVQAQEVGVSFAGYPSSYNDLCDDAHGLSPNMVRNANNVSVLSTHAIKQVTTGEGGVILTSNSNVYEYINEFTDHGRGYGNTKFGYGMNFRLPEINCALGLSQLNRAGENFIHRQMLARTYYNLLNDIQVLRLPADHADHAWHLFVVRFETKAMRDFVKDGLLADSNILTQIHYPPLSSYKHLRWDGYQNKNAYDAYETGLSLPMHNSLTFEDIELVAEAVQYQLYRWEQQSR